MLRFPKVAAVLHGVLMDTIVSHDGVDFFIKGASGLSINYMFIMIGMLEFTIFEKARSPRNVKFPCFPGQP